jgi:L-fuculose-phosphate aldolase
MDVSEQREAIADACRRLAAEGLVLGTAGNVSVRDGDQVLMTATGCVFEKAEPEHVTVVGLDGELLDDGLAPSSEVELHLGVYRRMDHAGAVVHTHSPMATALSCVVDEVPAVHYQMLQLGGSLPVAPYATFGTEELAENVLEKLSERTAALMANHGAIAYGLDLVGAVENALLAEWACSIYWRARMIGEPRVLNADQLADVLRTVGERSYGTMRKAGDG